MPHASRGCASVIDVRARSAIIKMSGTTRPFPLHGGLPMDDLERDRGEYEHHAGYWVQMDTHEPMYCVPEDISKILRDGQWRDAWPSDERETQRLTFSAWSRLVQAHGGSIPEEARHLPGSDT